MLIITKLL